MPTPWRAQQSAACGNLVAMRWKEQQRIGQRQNGSGSPPGFEPWGDRKSSLVVLHMEIGASHDSTPRGTSLLSAYMQRTSGFHMANVPLGFAFQAQAWSA